MSYAKIMPRRGTAYEWETENPILAEGEFAIECPESGIGTGLCKFKFGDGFRPWNRLPYAFNGASASSIVGGNAYTYNLIVLRQDYHENWLAANPIMEDGELIYVIDYLSFKMGDGVSTYEQLPWVGKQYEFDFGDEDAVPDANTLSANMPNTATLADLIEKTVEESSGQELVKGVPLTNPETKEPVIAIGGIVEDSNGKVITSTMSVISDAEQEDSIEETEKEEVSSEDESEESANVKTSKLPSSKGKKVRKKSSSTE